MSDTNDGLIDLDALRVERAEKGEAKAPRVKLSGKIYQLPAELPASFIVSIGDLQAGDMAVFKPMLEEIFGDLYGEVLQKMSAPDLMAFMEQLPDKYGLQLGESAGSTPS